jgi:hypothetical protein
MAKGKWGCPYMGSKEKIAQSICLALPKADRLYDLFGGGFSISHCAASIFKHKWKSIHYNEIKSDIVELVQDAIAGKYSYDNFKPEWISRERFFAEKDTNAYIRICWSFGNNQKDYLFSPKIESYKKSMHQAVVFDEFDTLASQVIGFARWPKKLSITQKRLFLRRKTQSYLKTKFPDFLKSYLSPKRLHRLQGLEQLQQLQQLQRLERLQKLQHIEFTALDYRDVFIKPGSIVYCDIPYDKTAGYGQTFDNKAFHDWAVSREFPVYFSEYEINDSRFEKFYTVEKRVLLAGEGMNKIAKENIYWNKVSL